MPDDPTPSQTTTAPDTGSPTEPDHKAEAEKWKAMSRKHEAQAKENAAAAKRLAEIEEAQKSDAQKAADREATALQRAEAAEAKALRYEVGVEKGIPTNLLRYLSGATRDELEANAAQLLADFGAAASPGTPPPAGRPREALRPGAAPAATPEPGQVINDRIRQAAGRRA